MKLRLLSERFIILTTNGISGPSSGIASDADDAELRVVNKVVATVTLHITNSVVTVSHTIRYI